MEEVNRQDVSHRTGQECAFRTSRSCVVQQYKLGLENDLRPLDCRMRIRALTGVTQDRKFSVGCGQPVVFGSGAGSFERAVKRAFLKKARRKSYQRALIFVIKSSTQRQPEVYVYTYSML